MTLIEVLLYYRELVREGKQEEGIAFIHCACEEHLWTDIEASVDKKGNFITALKQSILLNTVEPITED